MGIGRDNGLVVDLAYEDKAPYSFTGTVKKVVFDLKPMSHEEEKALHTHHAVENWPTARPADTGDRTTGPTRNRSRRRTPSETLP